MKSMNETLAAALVVLTASACPISTGPQPAPEAALLSSMGFALTDDADPSTPAGTLRGSFDGPVIAAGESLTVPGTAHVDFDDAGRDLASAGVVDAYPGTDIAYVILFQTDAPWRYVIIGAHAADLVAGATLALDGSVAAAIVVDETTGSGFVATSGTVSLTNANVQRGGSVAGSIVADLAEVALASWPEALFPMSPDGQPTERLASTGAGTFSAVYSLTLQPPEQAFGTASVHVEVDGRAAFDGTKAYAGPMDEGSIALAIEDTASQNALVVVVRWEDLVPGTLVLDGYRSGAWLISQDGTQYAFSGGTLSLDAVDQTEGGIVSGSLVIGGDAWLLPPDGFEGPRDPNDGQTCTGNETLAATFVPVAVNIAQMGPEESIPGYDKVLTFVDAGQAMLGLIVGDTVNLTAGLPYDFSWIDFTEPDGTISRWPASMLQLSTCDQPIPVENGSLTAALNEQTMRFVGSLLYVVDGQSRTLTFDLPATLDSGPPAGR